MKFMLQNKDKDLLGIYQCGYDPFCVSLLTDSVTGNITSIPLILTQFYSGSTCNTQRELP